MEKRYFEDVLIDLSADLREIGTSAEVFPLVVFLNTMLHHLVGKPYRVAAQQQSERCVIAFDRLNDKLCALIRIAGLSIV